MNEIQEKARIAREQSKGTPAEEITKVVDEKVQEWPDNKEQVPFYIEDLINYLKIKIPFYKDAKYINDSIEEIRTEKDSEKRLQIIAKLIPIIPQIIVIDNSITTGSIKGEGIAVGHNAKASVKITQEISNEILDLLEQLRTEIQRATIPDSAKNILLSKAVPEMEEAIKSDEPKSGLERGLERINDQLEGVGVTASNATGIVEKVTKIAQTAGIALKTVMPFISAIL